MDSINELMLILIGLRFTLPLLVHPTPSWKSIGKIYIEGERKRWAAIKKKVRCCDIDAITHFTLKYDFREI